MISRRHATLGSVLHCESSSAIDDDKHAGDVYYSIPKILKNEVKPRKFLHPSMKCLLCQETTKGGGVCGFDTKTHEFLCLCKQGNVTTYCKDPNLAKHKGIGAVAGTVMAVSSAGAIGVAGGIFWYLRKVRAKAPVACGVQSNENRIF